MPLMPQQAGNYIGRGGFLCPARGRMLAQMPLPLDLLQNLLDPLPGLDQLLLLMLVAHIIVGASADAGTATARYGS